MTGVSDASIGVHGGAERGVGHVDHHAQLVHALHHLQPEVAEAAVVALEDAVADERLAAVGQPASRIPAL